MKDLKGFARAVDALFQGSEHAPRTGSEHAPGTGSDVTHGDVSGHGGGADVSDDLAADARVWMESPAGSGERHELAARIRGRGDVLKATGALDPLADAVEVLGGSGGSVEPASVALARDLLTPAVASRIVARLGAARDEARRSTLLDVCGHLGHEMALAVSDALSDTNDRFARRSFLEAMVAMGEDSMPVLESMVDDGRWFVVRNAVAVLGDIGGERAVERITAGLAHTDARVRREALLSLAKVGGDDAGLLVYGMIEDSDAEVRLAAAMAAGALKVQRALKPLLTLLEQEEDPDVRVGVLRALGQLGDPGAVNAIEPHTQNSFFSRAPVDVRIAAFGALHHIGTPKARALLDEGVEDKDPEVRVAVRQFIRASDVARAGREAELRAVAAVEGNEVVPLERDAAPSRREGPPTTPE